MKLFDSAGFVHDFKVNFATCFFSVRTGTNTLVHPTTIYVVNRAALYPMAVYSVHMGKLKSKSHLER